MESRIIYLNEQFISYLFGNENDYDPEQRIYNKLLQMEGEELKNWIDTKLKKYITGKEIYYPDYQGENFEGIKGICLFIRWYKCHLEYETDGIMCVEEIYKNCDEEYFILREKVRTYQKETLGYLRRTFCEVEFISNYLEMLVMTKTAEDLKAYIIQLVEPIEIR